jgi:hypothetical protein
MSYCRRMPIPRIRATARLVRNPKSPPKLSEVANNKGHDRIVATMGIKNRPF